MRRTTRAFMRFGAAAALVLATAMGSAEPAKPTPVSKGTADAPLGSKTVAPSPAEESSALSGGVITAAAEEIAKGKAADPSTAGDHKVLAEATKKVAVEVAALVVAAMKDALAAARPVISAARFRLDPSFRNHGVVTRASLEKAIEGEMASASKGATAIVAKAGAQALEMIAKVDAVLKPLAEKSKAKGAAGKTLNDAIERFRTAAGLQSGRVVLAARERAGGVVETVAGLGRALLDALVGKAPAAAREFRRETEAALEEVRDVLARLPGDKRALGDEVSQALRGVVAKDRERVVREEREMRAALEAVELDARGGIARALPGLGRLPMSRVRAVQAALAKVIVDAGKAARGLVRRAKEGGRKLIVATKGALDGPRAKAKTLGRSAPKLAAAIDRVQRKLKGKHSSCLRAFCVA